MTLRNWEEPNFSLDLTGTAGAGLVPARWAERNARSCSYRRVFDPSRVRIVVLDQRGWGRSLADVTSPSVTRQSKQVCSAAPDTNKGISMRRIGALVVSQCRSAELA